jgi:abortive infection bacteriophage resistance protein
MNKPKLSIEEQIDHMRDVKGIQFNIIDEEQARKFLAHNNYYFKLKSYAKNYNRHANGKYVDLEFAYLVELSTLDMHLRKMILKMTLDIEHFLKTQLLFDFSKSPDENGYSIIKRYIELYPWVNKKIEQKGQYSVCSDLVKKYKDDFAIWNIIEVLSLSGFIKLYNLYYKIYGNPCSMSPYLPAIKYLRNAAAHNTCLLNSLKIPYTKFTHNINVNTYVSKIPGITPNIRKSKMANPVVHDFIVSLYVFNSAIVSPRVKLNLMRELKELLDDRFKRNSWYFEKNELIIAYFKFLRKIVDFFYQKII